MKTRCNARTMAGGGLVTALVAVPAHAEDVATRVERRRA